LSTGWPRWKPSIFLGNDLVWLDDPANRGRYADLLLVRRVLTPKERLLVQVSPDPDRMLWSLWAAKEAAFKAVSRVHPGTVFSPSQFEVHPQRTGAQALVHWQSFSWPVVWTQGPDWVHAVVCDSRVGSVVERRGEGVDESVAVRELAIRSLAREGLTGVIEGRPPVFRSEAGEMPVSLSHDGPYVAVAFPR